MKEVAATLEKIHTCFEKEAATASTKIQVLFLRDAAAKLKKIHTFFTKEVAAASISNDTLFMRKVATTLENIPLPQQKYTFPFSETRPLH
jgi:hypothetical protein